MTANASFYRNKRVLVTGGTGLIGISVVRKLLSLGAQVTVVSLDASSSINKEAEFIKGNLTDWHFCKTIVKHKDFVFHLAGTKGAVSTGVKKAASFFVPHLIFNTFMMEAARQETIDRYLYASTIGIYPAAPVFTEDHAWDGPPHPSNLYAGWAKRMGELQAEAYKQEFGWSKIAIVRPANVYGPHDYFDVSSSMVVPSLIRRAVEGENPFIVWGDGTPIRDFVYVDDAADGVLMALEKAANCIPINLGSGIGYSIKELVDVIKFYFPDLEVKWDAGKPNGEQVRVLDIKRAQKMLGYKPQVTLKEGIGKTIEWYRNNKGVPDRHYNIFHEAKLIHI